MVSDQERNVVCDPDFQRCRYVGLEVVSRREGRKEGKMAKSFSPTLLLLVGLVRCQLPGQESRILNNGGATRNQPPVLMRGGPTSGDLRNLQVRTISMIIMPK